MADHFTGWLIRYWRRLLHLSQEALAERAGIPQPRLSDIERGKLQPSFSMLTALATALDIPVGYLSLESPLAEPLVPKRSYRITDRAWDLALRLSALADDDLNVIEAMIAAAEKRNHHSTPQNRSG